MSGAVEILAGAMSAMTPAEILTLARDLRDRLKRIEDYAAEQKAAHEFSQPKDSNND